MRHIEERRNGRVGFRVRVQPSSRKDEIVGWSEAGELRIRLAAKPVEGAANRRLIGFLAERLGQRKRDLALESGERSRSKILSAPASARRELESYPEI
jgi:uncharacterized protein (TIGR00251 family)